MNMHNSELIMQASKHNERRERLWHSPAPQSAPKPETRSVSYVPYKAQQIPLWIQTDLYFDAHSKDWMLERSVYNSPVSFLKRRCDDLNVPYSVMIGESRRKEIAIRRQLLMYEIHERFGCSFPKIGKLLGGRDHTTCLYGYRKIEAFTDEQRAAIVPLKRTVGRAGQ